MDSMPAVHDAEEEAVSALLALGYKPTPASKVVAWRAKDGMTSEQLIREAIEVDGLIPGISVLENRLIHFACTQS